MWLIALEHEVRRISFVLDEPIAFIDVTPGGLARGHRPMGKRSP